MERKSLDTKQLIQLALFYLVLYSSIFSWIKKKWGLGWALLFVGVLLLPTALVFLTGRILGQDASGRMRIFKWRS